MLISIFNDHIIHRALCVIIRSLYIVVFERYLVDEVLEDYPIKFLYKRLRVDSSVFTLIDRYLGLLYVKSFKDSMK